MTNEYRTAGDGQRAAGQVAKRANSNNDEESIFIASSSEEDDKQQDYQSAYQSSKKTTNSGKNKYDEYDPENIDDYNDNKKHQKYQSLKYGGKSSQQSSASPSGSDENEAELVSDDSAGEGYEKTSEDDEDEENQVADYGSSSAGDESDEEDNRVLSDFLGGADESQHKKSAASVKLTSKAAVEAAKPAAKVAAKRPSDTPPAQKKSATVVKAATNTTPKSQVESNSKTLKKPSSDHLVSLKKTKSSPADKHSSPKVSTSSSSSSSSTATPKKATAVLEPAKARKRSNEDENDVDAPNSGKMVNLASGFKIPKRNNQDSDKSGVAPEKRAKLEETKPVAKAKTPAKAPVAVPAAKVPIAAPKPATPAPAKPAPAPAKNILQDSSAFMEAFGSSKPKVAPKPKPLVKSSSLEQGDSAATSSNLNSPAASSSTSAATSNTNLNHINNINRDDQTAADKSDGTGMKSNLSEPVMLKKSANKKKVVWADTAAAKPLELIHTFYLDESERTLKRSGLAKGTATAGDLAKMDRLSEKELRLRAATNGGYEGEFGGIGESENGGGWPAQLIRIDLPDTVIQPEIHSAENEIQKAREASTLAMLMFKQFLPDSPSEPTEDSKTSSSEQIQSKIIPLEDITQQISAMNNESGDVEMASTGGASSPSFRSNSGFDYFSNRNNVHFNRNQPQQHYQPGRASNENDFAPKKQVFETPAEPAVSKEESKPVSPPADSSKLLNIVNQATVFLPSDEAAEQIKQILKQIGSTPASGATAAPLSLPNLTALAPAPVAPVVQPQPVQAQQASLDSVIQALLTFNKTPISNDIPKSAQQSDGNDDDYNNAFGRGNFSNDFNRKPKWNNNNNSNGGWNNKFNDNQKNFRNGNANNNNNNNNNGGGFNGNNSADNRNVFVNSHKRGMGNRGGFTDFRGSNNKGGFGRGGGGNNNNQSGNQAGGNNRWQNFNNSRGGGGGNRFNKPSFRPNFNKNDEHDKNYENNDDASFNHRRRSDGDDEWSDGKGGFKRGPGGRRNSNNDDIGAKGGDLPSQPVAAPLPMVKANTTAQGGGSWV